MSGLPPPAGSPVSMLPPRDPWLEQARRDKEHRAARRQRRRRWLLPIGGLLLVVGCAGAALAVRALWPIDDGSGNASREANPTVDSLLADDAAGATTTVVIAPDGLVRVDEVWLVDRGAGVYDWGVTVRAAESDAIRSGVVIEVRLLDDAGAIVKSENSVINGVNTESSAGLAGQLVDSEAVPTRIEFDISVGRSSNDASFDDLLDVRALDRDGDEVSGRIRSVASVDVNDIVMLLVWRDDDGRVIATVAEEIEVLRPGVDARFVIDVSGRRVPDGRPDDVLWVS